MSFTCLTVAGFAAGWAVSAMVGRMMDLVLLNSSVERVLRNFLPIESLFHLLLEGVYDDQYVYKGTVFLLKDISSKAAFGVVLGTAQWFELRRYLGSSPLWILSTGIGYAVSSNLLLLALITSIVPKLALERLLTSIINLLSASLSDSPASLIVLSTLAFLALLMLTNALVGFSQWVVLRRSLHSVWWWILIPVVAGIASIPMYLGLVLVNRLSPPLGAISFVIYIGILVAINSVFYGAIQSLSLCTCRRRRLPES